MGPIGSPETSALNQPSMSNNQEDGRIQVNRNGNLRSPKVLFTQKLRINIMQLRTSKIYGSHLERNHRQLQDMFLRDN
jgi:hypothetical protein